MAYVTMNKIPKSMVIAVSTISVLPFLFTLIGVDFGTDKSVIDLDELIHNTPHQLTDALFNKLAGAFTHTILEWSAFCTAIFTALLALAHFKIKHSVIIPLIGMTLFYAGSMDAFHTLAANRLIEAAADNRNLIPFTWAICRIFNPLIMIAGMGIIVCKKKRKSACSIGDFNIILISTLLFGFAAYLIVRYCATKAALPQTMFPDSLITRPYDVAPLLIFLVAGFIVFPAFYKKEPTIFSHALIISVIPNVAAQLHMAFGSTSLFDNNFNIAHFLKIVAYMVPFGGLVLDYIQTYQTENERKRELKNSDTKIRAIVDSTLTGIITIDKQGFIELFNMAAKKIFGYDESDVIGQNINMLMPEPYRSAHDSYLSNYFATGEAKVIGIGREVVGKRKNGTTFPMELSVSEMQLSNKKMFIGLVADITESKESAKAFQTTTLELAKTLAVSEQLRMEAEKLKEDAETANRAKSEFLASMSHEIRTPMNAIIGMGDLLDETGLTGEQKKYVDTFRYAGENLLSIINDILDISKIEAGHLELEKAPFDLEELIEMTSDIMIFRTREKGLELNVSLAKDIPMGLIGDVTRLRQVIINLVGNAIKFTEKGEISISVKSEQADENKVKLIFSVKDTGIGIPSEKLKTIFENFSQVDSSTTRQYGGTGLGLSICRSIVDLMGGRIWVESKKGEGCTFYFIATFIINKEFKGKAQENEIDLKGLMVLIADDNMISRLTLQKTLNLWGAKTAVVNDGATCLAEIQRAKESGEPYKLLLLSYNMPDMDGLVVIKEIKKRSEIDITIILLTSSAVQVRSAAEETGISICLSKPVKRFDLRRALNFSLLTPMMKKTIDTGNTEPRIPDRSLNILLVEDIKDNRNLIRMYLKKTSHTLDMAINGQIAVEKITATGSRYDLILMDVEMPVKDGLTATREIRAWEKEKNNGSITILALTAHALKEFKEKSLAAGCDGYLTKPIKKKVLLEEIGKYS